MITDTGSALLADIIEHPDDDGLRLVYADWLEDGGQAERAWIVRLGVEQVARPGAPALCKPPGGRLIELPCPPGADEALYRGGFVVRLSLTLKAWGDEGGRLRRNCPLLGRVVLTDRRPDRLRGVWLWLRAGPDVALDNMVCEYLPPALHALVDGPFGTRDAALDALAAAALEWAREA